MIQLYLYQFLYPDINHFRNQLYKYFTEKDSLMVIKTPKYSLFTFKLDNAIYGGSYTEGIFKIVNNPKIWKKQ